MQFARDTAEPCDLERTTAPYHCNGRDEVGRFKLHTAECNMITHLITDHLLTLKL